ncbi:UB Xdomain protein Ubx2 [Schizosaccharomyces japonicus yFS275]|uniref:UB Xdomain protein Ubx2 n=1 Tax=Schizosaccharomyces japonicus (strain yFS275 / FY16936) TaxID=402676 RepID=B6JZI1_SCHJY|nr:UB Xdomain protein Ubx2 [Schizosaccharomyces japonicus yFS275]EEB06949.1 UB Xdomain protein Ubx2 [Schizosaccharomyces japonicus yFS275]
MESDLIAQFCAITNSSAEKAQEFLMVADGDLSTAVTLFFESGGVTGTEASDVSAGASSSAASTNADADYVRAPIAPTREVLVDPVSDFSSNILNEAMLGARGIASPRMNRRQRRRVGIFDQSPFARPPSDTGTDETDDDSPTTSRASRLAKLFRPPYDIITALPLESARALAADKQKWLLVNLQTSSSFECQVLNRDLWKNDSVKAVIRAHFIFLQYLDDEEPGLEFKRYYPVESTPHIAILDPRTGERLKAWNKGFTPAELVVALNDFLEQCSFDESNGHKNPLGPKAKKPVEAMSEEEQLHKAIAASLGASAGSEDAVMKDNNEDEIEGDEEEEEDVVEQVPNTVNSINVSDLPTDEPAAGPATTRIQVRMANGSRFIRRFLKADPVRYVYAFAKQMAPGSEGKPFTLTFQRKNLWDLRDKNIEEAGIGNAALQLEFE